MKKVVVSCLLLAALPLLALRPGGTAAELSVKWLDGRTFTLKAFRVEPGKPALRVAVFMRTLAANAEDTLRLLEELSESYAGTATFAVVTPDSEGEARTLLNNHPGFKLPFGIDRDRLLTAKYMESSILYPMAFLVDPQGEILWCGEAVDLGETLEACRKGSFDAGLQRRIAQQIDELQLQLRNQNERRIKEVGEAILKEDPGNPSTLRILTFALEHSGKAPEALALIEGEIKKRPELLRLRLAALDLALRYPETAARAIELADGCFREVPGNPDADNLLAWMLLIRRPEDVAAAQMARRYLERAQSGFDKLSPTLKAAQLTSRALLAWRIGRLDQALALQKEATRFWGEAKRPREKQESQNREALYEGLRKLSTK